MVTMVSVNLDINNNHVNVNNFSLGIKQSNNKSVIIRTVALAALAILVVAIAATIGFFIAGVSVSLLAGEIAAEGIGIGIGVYKAIQIYKSKPNKSAAEGLPPRPSTLTRPSLLRRLNELERETEEQMKKHTRDKNSKIYNDGLSLIEFIKCDFMEAFDDGDKSPEMILESAAKKYKNFFHSFQVGKLEGNEKLGFPLRQLELFVNMQTDLDIDSIKSYFKANQNYINRRCSRRLDTILHYIAMRGDAIRMVSILENLGADFGIQDWMGNTPLMWAIANANNTMAKEILKCGVKNSKSYLDRKCNRGNTALHLAVGKGYKDINAQNDILTVSNLQLLMQMVAQGAAINIQNNQGNTPLHLACARKDFEMIKALIGERKLGDFLIKNINGQTPESLLNLTYKEARALVDATVWPNSFGLATPAAVL